MAKKKTADKPYLIAFAHGTPRALCDLFPEAEAAFHWQGPMRGRMGLYVRMTADAATENMWTGGMEGGMAPTQTYVYEICDETWADLNGKRFIGVPAGHPYVRPVRVAD